MMYNITEVAEMLTRFADKPPCAFPDLESSCIGDEWCESHCTVKGGVECWCHALDNGWVNHG